jgi:hypothetical protein
MAALTSTNVTAMWANDAADKCALYAIKGMSAADTIDFGASNIGAFKAIKFAVIIGTTFAGAATCTVATTVVTVPAGPSLDAGYMLVWGVSV